MILLEEFTTLTDEEVLRLLSLRYNLCYGTPDKTDEDIITLEEKGYITQNSAGMLYDFTPEGKKLTEEFWTRYSEIVKKVIKENGANFLTYARLVNETGLSWKIIGRLLFDLKIEIKP